MKNKDLHKNKGGFKIPDGYFENFESRLSEKLSSPIPEKDGFKVPDTYFDSLAENINNKIENEPVREVPVRRLSTSRTFKYIGYAVAAGLALLLFMNIFSTSKKEVSWNDIASAEIENYIEQGYLSFNAYEYANIFEDVDLSKIEIEEEKIESEELLDYLYENVSSYDELILEN
ncbi:hypothetical protein ACJD0Z_11900 [Flavobacteriaceae bacterium M23B6Z8]